MCVRTHTSTTQISQTNKERKGGKMRQKETGLTHIQQGNREKRWPFFLCLYAVASRDERIKRNNAGKTWLSVCIVYIELDWWELILTFMFCMGSLSPQGLENIPINIEISGWNSTACSNLTRSDYKQNFSLITCINRPLWKIASLLLFGVSENPDTKH